MADEDQTVDIDLSMSEELAAEARTNAEGVEKLTKEIRSLNRQLLLLDKRGDKAVATLTRLEAATAAYTGKQTALTEATEKTTEAAKKYTATQSKSTKQTKKHTDVVKKATKQTNLFTRSYRGITKLFGTMLRLFPMQLLMWTAMASVIAAAIPYVIQIGQALFSLLGFLLVTPNAIGVMIGGMLSLMVATKGVGAAIGAAFDTKNPAAFAEALKDLSPQARKFAKTIKSWVPQFKAIKKVAQDALFAPLNKQMPNALKKLVPIFKTGIKRVSAVWGNLFADMTKEFSSARGQKAWKSLFRNTEHFGNNIRRGIIPIMRGWEDIMVTMESRFNGVGDSIESVMKKFGGWLQKIAKNGQAKTWFDNALEAGRQLIGLFKEIGRFFKYITQFSQGMSFSPLINLLKIINDFLESPAGSQALSDLFSALKQVFDALAPVVATVANVIATVLAPILADIITTLAPYVDTVFRAIGDALKTTAPMWGKLADAVGKLLVALIPILDPLAQLLVYVGTELANAFILLAPIIATLLTVLLKPLGAIFKVLGKLLEKQAPFIEDIASAFADFMEQVTPLLDEFGEALMDGMVQALELLIPLWQEIAPVFKDFIKQVGQAYLKALKDLMPVFLELIDAFLELLTVVLTPENIKVIVQLIQLFLDFALMIITHVIPVFAQIISWVVQLITWGVRLYTKWLEVGKKIGEYIGKYFVKPFLEFVRKVKEKKDEILKWLKDPWEKLKDFVEGIIDGLSRKLSTITDAVKGAKDKLASVGSFLNPFDGRATGGPVEAGHRYTVGEIGKEMFLPDSGGDPTMIGTHGQERRTFAESGTVLPNYMVNAMEQMRRSVNKENARSSGEENTELAKELATALAGAKGGDTYNYNVSVPVTASDEGKVDTKAVKRAVKQAIAEIEKDRKERS